MKKLYILFSVIVILFIVFFNCQQTGGSGGGGGGGGDDDDTPVKWASQKKIIAPFASSADDDFFGNSVSISGDYAIVGAPFEEGVGETSQGSVYIFHRTGTNTWDTGTPIHLMATADNDFFGGSVSISGDYAIVGAIGEDSDGTNSGAAYILHRTGTNLWYSVIKIKASDAEDNAHFGSSVSISGDYAIVGAEDEDGSGLDKGAAYIFHNRTGENIWDEVTKITVLGTANNDFFGKSVSISGDYAIVGAYRENGVGGTNSGAAYIFHRTGENIWDAVTKITASDAAENDMFGYSVSISGDYAIVGASGVGSSKGVVYIFHRTEENIWGEEIKLKTSVAANEDYFGYSVSISGDYVIVGAFGGGDGIFQGASYIFHRIGTNTWDAGRKITAYDAAVGDEFGYSVSISGDYAIIGAHRKLEMGLQTGVAYIFK